MGLDTLNQGDFVERSVGGAISVGVVAGVENTYSDVEFSPDDPISKDIPEARLTRLDTADERAEAIERERRQGLLQIALQLKEVQEKASWITSRIDGGSYELPMPRTGIFVVVGVYSGYGPHPPYITIVSAMPPMTEKQVADKLKEMHPSGFATIPGESTVLPGTSRGGLTEYRCHELPEYAVSLIDWGVEEEIIHQ